MLPFLLSIALSSCGVQSWASDSTDPSHHPYRVPLAATLSRSRANAASVTLQSSDPRISSPMDDAADHALLSRGHVIFETPIRMRSTVERMTTEPHNVSKRPLEVSNDVEKEHLVLSTHAVRNTVVPPVRDREVFLYAMVGGRRFDNPVFRARRVWKRSASENDGEEEDERGGEGEVAPKGKNATGFSGFGGNLGLSEVEITVIVVCSALGLLACIVGLIFLARYYWKKVHGNNHGYQGVLQRDSSESSMGTTRIDVKEANAKLEEIDITSSKTKETEAMITRHQSVDNSAEKALLLPCANGTAVVEHSSITVENENVSLPTQDKEKNEDITASVDSETIHMKMTSENETIKTLYSCLGLSQSDCSISSYTANNPSYKYGNQIAYMAGYYGYPCDDSFGGEVLGDTTSFQQESLSLTEKKTSIIPTDSIADNSGSHVSGPEKKSHVESKSTKAARGELIVEEAEVLDETSDVDNEPASPGFAEAEDVGEGGHPNGTDNSASSVFDMDTEHSKISVNNSLIELQEDEDSCRLTEANRAISLPESFSPKEESSESVELIKPGKTEPPARPEDSGWGDTVKSQFRGSLPVIHLNISPNSNGEFAKRSSSSTSYPVSEAASPNDIEGKPLLSSRALSNLPNTFDNIQMVNELKTERGTILS